MAHQRRVPVAAHDELVAMAVAPGEDERVRRGGVRLPLQDRVRLAERGAQRTHDVGRRSDRDCVLDTGMILAEAAAAVLGHPPAGADEVPQTIRNVNLLRNPALVVGARIERARLRARGLHEQREGAFGQVGQGLGPADGVRVPRG